MPDSAAPRATGTISPQSRRHNDMRRAALKAHPELADLSGPEPRTALALPILFAIQWGIAWAVSDGGLLLVGLTAFLIGQIVYHSAASLIHETCHKLVFRGDRAKLAFDLGLEAILTSYGKQLTYQHQHVTSHHPFVGDYERDYEHEDICALQARQHVRRTHPVTQRLLTLLTLFLHALPLGFMLGDAILPRLYAWASGRPVADPVDRFTGTRPDGRDMRPFIAVSLISNLAMLALLGPWALLYHLWSLSFFLGKLGISNLGQSLSEHPGTDDENPTRSTYGPLNLILFNTGYHNEHHSFPNVPWTRLPDLHRIAPDVFHATSEKSYLGHWWDHVRADFSPSRDLKIHETDQLARCEGKATPAE
ncbi:fatty acid desaturase [Shimia aestuarii]|uniref:fatty acid desaturase n=1 Tax=Shimia aestuarii TaxID=254406 RepID=UPI001FB3B5A6|nr:fatty acid desaturase [Shimia aestuarii]